MEKIKNLSLRKSIILYVSIAFVISFFAAAFVSGKAKEIQEEIWNKYVEETYEDIWDQIQEKDSPFSIRISRISSYEMTEWENIISETCDFLQTWSVLIFSMASCVIAVFLFYRNKIREPLKELSEGAKKISKDDLNFSLTYQNKDEMGRLCLEFERMRSTLVSNNKEMWQMMEQEKALRSAVAHEIRSPLAVLKGYQEMLMEFLPEGKMEKEQIVEALQSGMEQIQRLQDFLDTMKELSSLEDRKVKYREISMWSMKNQMEKTAQLMSRHTKITCEISCSFLGNIKIDESIVYEVYENLLANSLRYAKKTVKIFLSVDDKKRILEVRILDDGEGFTEDFEKVTKPYYHTNSQDDFTHFGLGLYLCRMYCEKHEGKLLIANGAEGGADVRARFHMV